MPAIRILPGRLVAKIAAGEVIQKPFNVVKELVENSIDAGATSISLELDGPRNVTVSDDGSGMSPEDARLACLQHATSKISDEKDLHSISTLGFRGEALASIAAVSNLTLKTSNTQSGEGVELKLGDGKEMEPRPIGMPRGTTIAVRDLFHNVPARRKFLDSEVVELKRILEVVRDYSLAYPEISFSVADKTAGSVLFKTSAGTPETRLQDVLKDVAQNLLPISASSDYAKVSGFVGKPGFVRRDKRYQFAFVNRRLVKNALVERAVSDTLPILPSHHPVFILFLEIAPSKVDVNVHPDKLEIKFSDEEQLYALVSGAVFPVTSKKAEISEKLELSERKGKVYETPKGRQEILGTANAQQMQNQQAQPTSQSLPQAQEIPQMQSQPMVVRQHPPQAVVQHPQPIVESPIPYRVIGQMNRTYILCEARGHLVLLDQHAVQEKIFFEKFFSARAESKQELLSPVAINLGLDYPVIKGHMAGLAKKGLELEDFGNQSVVVRAVPSAFIDYYGEVNADSLNDLVLNLRLWEKEFDGADYLKYATKACKSALKAGKELTLAEMSELVSELQNCKNPNTCPHGRPIAVKISVGELEKKFKRKV